MLKRQTSKVYPPPNFIDYESYDLIWLYQEWLYPDFKHFSLNTLVTGMDCSTMLFFRALKKGIHYRPFATSYKFIAAYLLESGIKKEHAFHVMGKPDLDFFQKINSKVFSFYCLHPPPPFEKAANKSVAYPIVIGVTGGYKEFYHRNFFRDLLSTLNQQHFLSQVHWSLVGKGWEDFAEGLKSCGYSVQVQEWVDSFVDYMDTIHIHLVPIEVGAGTKGKVLQSVFSDVITIGTECAFENIIENDSILKFESADEAYILLRNAVDDIQTYYDEMVDVREEVVQRFNSAIVVEEFWKMANQYCLLKEKR
jgi:hypothetical protein